LFVREAIVVGILGDVADAIGVSVGAAGIEGQLNLELVVQTVCIEVAAARQRDCRQCVGDAQRCGLIVAGHGQRQGRALGQTFKARHHEGAGARIERGNQGSVHVIERQPGVDDLCEGDAGTGTKRSRLRHTVDQVRVLRNLNAHLCRARRQLLRPERATVAGPQTGAGSIDRVAGIERNVLIRNERDRAA
jgi:hypothetical protein